MLQNYISKKPGSQGPLYPYLHDTVRLPDNGPSELYPPEGGGRYPNPIISNEYAFFWINRDGQPTYLSQFIFNNLYQDTLSTEQRREEYAKKFARLTHYWRTTRTSAALMHFCVLGYSRHKDRMGFTSDNFVDVAGLEFEPHFEKYAFSAYYPVTLMIDRWEDWFLPGQKIDLRIRLINDRAQSWSGDVAIHLIDQGRSQLVRQSEKQISAMYSTSLVAEVHLPDQPGQYALRATLQDGDHEIFSLYEFTIKEASSAEDVQYVRENKQFIHVEQGLEK